MTWTLADVLLATGGRAAAGAARTTLIPAVATDSRRLDAGALFFALAGEHHDGHEFVADALRNGARYAVVHRTPAGVDGNRLIHVPDTLRALGDLAAWTRRHHSVPVVAVTGSSGKTTTKELIASICAAARFAPPRQRVLKTEGNFNNLIGLPLTLFRLQGDEAVAVLEMGMNRPGEIARLTEIARPDFALITNVGHAHLEGVGGTLEGVARAKGELFAGLADTAVIAVNTEDEWVRRLAAGFRGRQVRFGADGDVRAAHVAVLGVDGVAFDLRIDAAVRRVRLRLVGAHNVTNALAAAAIGHAMGFDIETIGRGLEQASVPAQRMQVVRLDNGVTLIDDAYNANPSSMDAALHALRDMPGRSLVVLGDMWELGTASAPAHRTVGARAAALGVCSLFLLGTQAAETAAGARAAGLPSEAIYIGTSHATVAAAVVAQWQPGDCVLVKGSHGMRMEEVVRLLADAGKLS